MSQKVLSLISLLEKRVKFHFHSPSEGAHAGKTTGKIPRGKCQRFASDSVSSGKNFKRHLRSDLYLAVNIFTMNLLAPSHSRGIFTSNYRGKNFHQNHFISVVLGLAGSRQLEFHFFDSKHPKSVEKAFNGASSFYSWEELNVRILSQFALLRGVASASIKEY